MRKVKLNAVSLQQELAALPMLDYAQLRKRFLVYYKTDAPATISSMMLRFAIAYQMQTQFYGGLKNSTHRKLLELAEQNTDNESKLRPTQVLASGMRLVREWHGVVHEVQIVEKGVLWNGKPYRSLSEVARSITGTHCSGPRFFGLKQNNNKDKHKRGQHNELIKSQSCEIYDTFAEKSLPLTIMEAV